MGYAHCSVKMLLDSSNAYYQETAAIVSMQLVCKLFHQVPWFLYIKILPPTMNLRVLDVDIRVYGCRFGESTVSVNCYKIFCFVCAQLQIFSVDGQHVSFEIFCILLHQTPRFCTIKMLPAKINLQVSDFDIRVYALGFGENIVPVNCCNCFYVVGAQLQIFFMGGQYVIIERFM